MTMRTNVRFVVAGAVAALGLSIPGAATALTVTRSCTQFDEKPDGALVATTAPHGATKALPNTRNSLSCTDGEWTVAVLTRTAHIDAITVHQDTTVTFDDVSFDGSADLSMSEFAGLRRELTGVQPAPVERVVVAADDGTELTDEQATRLLQDPFTSGVPVFGVTESPGPAVTFEALAGQAAADRPVRIIARTKVATFFGRLTKKPKRTNFHCSPACG